VVQIYCSHCGRLNAGTQSNCSACGAGLRQIITKRRLNVILGIFIALAAIAWIAALSSGPSSPPKQTAAPQQLLNAPTSTPSPTTTPQPKQEERSYVPRGEYRPPPRVASPSPTPDEEEITVYITRTGKKYHRGDCQYLRQSKIPISLADARDYYDPCSVCDPPQ
jgi:hypothetical protein